jgi:hypothetical protein
MDGVYLMPFKGRRAEMEGQSYENGDLLHQLISEYPNLLAGEEDGGCFPRRWLFVSSDASRSPDPVRSGDWPLSHLFLDQDAIPTLVEVKRGDNFSPRWELVGRMLETAANAWALWPVERFRADFEANCGAEGLNPAQVLNEFLAPDTDPDAFWEAARINLRAGRIRLVLVADEIPDELWRIVDFLNYQMEPAEVLAVEVKQDVAGGLKSVVPRVVGSALEV